jgi:hypothetical protein
MTGTEIALVIAACGTLVTALTSAYGVLVTIRNAQEAREQRGVIVSKLEAVHQSTNGLSERNEAIARKLGVAEGTAAEKAIHS